MKRKWLWISVGLLGAVGSTLFVWNRRSVEPAVDFASTRSIEMLDVFKEKKLEITDSNKVRMLVDAIAFKPKESCMCDHNLELVFSTASGTIRVSICEHCLDIVSPKPYRTYEMPPAFYALLKPQMEELGRQTGRTPAP